MDSKDKIGERLKELRKFLGKSQTSFSSKIGLPQTTYSPYETGTTKAPDIVIKMISSTYGVSEQWLKYGLGDMFNAGEKDHARMELFDQLMSEDADPWKKKIAERILRAIVNLTDDELAKLRELINDLADNSNED